LFSRVNNDLIFSRGANVEDIKYRITPFTTGWPNLLPSCYCSPAVWELPDLKDCPEAVVAVATLPELRGAVTAQTHRLVSNPCRIGTLPVPLPSLSSCDWPPILQQARQTFRTRGSKMSYPPSVAPLELRW